MKLQAGQKAANIDEDDLNVLLNESTPLLKGDSRPRNTPNQSRSALAALLGAFELAGRTGVVSYTMTSIVTKETRALALLPVIVWWLAWFYATVQPAFYAFKTLPYGLLAIHVLGALSSVAWFYRILVLHELHTRQALVLQVLNILIALFGVGVISTTKLHDNGAPEIVDGLEPAWDDHVSLLEWITFGWMSKFVAIGNQRPVEESDVWQLSQLMRARTLMTKFRGSTQKNLLRRLFYANALDLTADCTLSAGFAPRFLHRLPF